MSLQGQQNLHIVDEPVKPIVLVIDEPLVYENGARGSPLIFVHKCATPTILSTVCFRGIEEEVTKVLATIKQCFYPMISEILSH